MQSIVPKRLLACLALVAFVRANYYIDDQNYTALAYSGGVKWRHFQDGGETLSISTTNGTTLTVDACQCFNDTYPLNAQGIINLSSVHPADAACTTTDDCQVQIPFVGSGIIIYVLQAGVQGINASIVIDEGVPTYNALTAPPGPNFYIPNVTLFNVQGMTTGNHTATMTILNWNDVFSGMMFDYALINRTLVSDIPTMMADSVDPCATTSVPASTVTSSHSHPMIRVDALVGGTVGGLVVLALLLAILYCCRRRRKAARSSANGDDEPNIEPFFVGSQPDHRQRPTTENLVQPQSHPTNSGSFPREKARLRVSVPSASQNVDANVASPTPAVSSNLHSPASETSRPRVQQTHPMLTNDQADFVNNLYANNVPAGAVARVIESMMTGERRPAVDCYDSLPPPSYDQGTSTSAGDE